MSDAVKFGLVGYGTGGRIFHAPLLASAGNVDFLGVVTRSDVRRAELTKQHPTATAFDSLADLVAAGAEAVSISTPAATHAEVAQEAIALGLNVVVDLHHYDRLYDNVPKLWGRHIFSDAVTTRLVRAKHGDSSGVRGAAWLWDEKMEPQRPQRPPKH